MRRRPLKQGRRHSCKSSRSEGRRADPIRAALGLAGVAVKYLSLRQGNFGQRDQGDKDQRANCIEPDFKPASTGAEVSCSGGRRSGATRSARLRSRELHHMCPIWSLTSLADVHVGRDSSSSGGRTSGSITLPRLVKIVRYQGRLTASPISIPVLTGREVSCSGGSFSGKKRSRSCGAATSTAGR